MQIRITDAQTAERGGCFGNHRAQKLNSFDRLDQVDVSRQVRRHFEADFLFANGGLCPGLHDNLSSNRVSGNTGPDGLVGSGPLAHVQIASS